MPKAASKKSKTSAKSKKAKPKSDVTPFALQVAFLTPDNKRRVEFGMLRASGENNKQFFAIVFILSDVVSGKFQERVKVDVKVGDFLSDKTDAMIKKGLTLDQHAFLRGPITTQAELLPKGATEDEDLIEMHQQLVAMTPES